MKYFSLFIFFAFAGKSIFAEDSIPKDTLNDIELFYLESDIQFVLKNIDTSLSDFHYSYQLLHSFNAFLGNAGLASNSLFFNPQSSQGYITGINAFTSSFVKKEEVDFYHTRKPFTKAFYQIGPKEEQMVNLLHTQNIKKNWNAAINLTKSGGEGFYNRQKTNVTNFYASSNFLTMNKRYGVKAYLLFNKVEAQENGGLTNDSLLGSEDEVALPGSFDTYLSDADNSVKSFSLSLKHYLHFGNRDTISLNDSTKMGVISPEWKLYHSVSYGSNKFLFTDNNPDSTYYSTLFLLNDSIGIYDSISTRNIGNRFGLALTKNQKAKIDLWAEHTLITHQHNNGFDSTEVGFTNHSIDTNFQQVLAGALFEYRLSKSITIKANGAANIFGEWNGSYTANAGVSYLSKDSSIYADFSIEQSSNVPEFTSSLYANNYFNWSYSYLNIMETQVSGSLDFKQVGFSIGGSVNNFNNLIYYDAFSRPKQFLGIAIVLQAWAQKQFTLGNWHMDITSHWQEASQTIIRLPKWCGKASLYYENFLFKKATRARIGIDAFYFSSYKANAYMPLIREFYLQNDTRIGNYPYLDAYLAFRVKSARLFFKVIHFNADLMGSDYFLVPHYPNHPLLFRLGVDWVFIN